MGKASTMEKTCYLNMVYCDRCGTPVHVEKVFLSPNGKLCRWCLLRNRMAALSARLFSRGGLD